MEKRKGHGFIPDIIEDNHYVFGGARNLAGLAIQDNRDWSPFLAPDEFQSRNGFESMNCTNYGTLEAIETLKKRKYGILTDHSERALGILSETTIEGNSPHKVGETIRGKGLIEEMLLPFDNMIFSWDRYYSPKPLPDKLVYEATKWLTQWSFGHEWVFNVQRKNEPELMWEALRYSPLGVSVDAWNQEGDYYVKNGPDNHWTVVYAGEYQKWWNIKDSYDNTHKAVKWDYDFGMVKRYSLDEKKSTNESYTERILKNLKYYFSFFN
jgi:hypothetical protein